MLCERDNEFEEAEAESSIIALPEGTTTERV